MALEEPFISQNQRDAIPVVREKMQVWSQKLERLEAVKSSRSQADLLSFRDDFLREVQVLPSGQWFVVPTGVLGTTEYASAAVVEAVTPEQRNWLQLNSASSYHQQIDTFTKRRYHPVLTIQGIPLTAFTPELGEILFSLKALPPKTGTYQQDQLYTLVLARLNGESTFSDLGIEHFKTQRTYESCCCWRVVRDVLWLALKKQLPLAESRKTYKYLLFHFELSLMQEVSSVFRSVQFQTQAEIMVKDKAR
jgi:hypothetical protein